MPISRVKRTMLDLNSTGSVQICLSYEKVSPSAFVPGMDDAMRRQHSQRASLIWLRKEDASGGGGSRDIPFSS